MLKKVLLGIITTSLLSLTNLSYGISKDYLITDKDNKKNNLPKIRTIRKKSQ